MCAVVANQVQAKIQDYIELIEKVAKVEQRRIPSHMVEYEELVSIGIIAIQTMIKGKTEQQLARYNNAYISTAVRWAIRNELRNRYKWYSLKNTKEVESSEEGECCGGEDEKISPHKVREAIYTTILSIDSLQQANGDNESPFDFIRDTSALPDEKAEIPRSYSKYLYFPRFLILSEIAFPNVLAIWLLATNFNCDDEAPPS